MDIRKIVQEELAKVIAEQEEKPQEKEQPEEKSNSPFSEQEEAFLGKFAEAGSQHLGIIYSKTDVGIEEFLNRAGATLNLNAAVMYNLINKKIIKIVPYNGVGRNEDYTIQLNLPLDKVEQFKDKAEAGNSKDTEVNAGPPSEDEPSGPIGDEVPEVGSDAGSEAEESDINDWVVNYNTVIRESVIAAAQLVGLKKKLNEAKPNQRVLQRLPKGYLNHLNRIIQILSTRIHGKLEKEHLVADILDVLSHNFGLTPKQIYRSYVYYKAQNKLQNILSK